MLTDQDIIKTLTEHNDELENYFRNTIIPQLFIDADLVLRKFTPPAMRQFNLSNADVGKCIVEIRDNFRFRVFWKISGPLWILRKFLKKKFRHLTSNGTR